MAAPDARDTPHKYLAFQEFGSLNSQPSRTALEQDQFNWIENIMPIGNANAPVVPGPGATLATLGTSTATSTITGTVTAGQGAGPGSITATRFFGHCHGNTTFGANTFISEWGIFNSAGRISGSSMSYVGIAFDFGNFGTTQNTVLTDLAGWASLFTLTGDKRQLAAVDFIATNSVVSISFASGTGASDPPFQDHVWYQTMVVKSPDQFNWVYVQTVTAMAPTGEMMWGPTWTITPLSLPGARRYWRLSNWQNDLTHDVQITEAHLYYGGTDKTTEAVITTNFTFSAGVLSNTYDNDFTSLIQISNSNLSGGYIQYDFGSPTFIDGMRIASAGGDGSLFPWQVTLDYSNDASNWVFAGRLELIKFPGTNTWGQICTLYS